jgi:hypothetical protein
MPLPGAGGVSVVAGNATDRGDGAAIVKAVLCGYVGMFDRMESSRFAFSDHRPMDCRGRELASFVVRTEAKGGTYGNSRGK